MRLPHCIRLFQIAKVSACVNSEPITLAGDLQDCLVCFHIMRFLYSISVNMQSQENSLLLEKIML